MAAMHDDALILPTFRYRDAAAMIDWLVAAFGFRVIHRHDHDGRVAHAELALGNSFIMLGGVAEDTFGSFVGTPGEQGGKSVYVTVSDIDGCFDRATAAGARILKQPTETDYDTRHFVCADPEGNVWTFGTYRPGTQGS